MSATKTIKIETDSHEINSVKQKLLMKSLVEFYSNETNVQRMLPIIKKKTNISLRLLDWFVTNYSKNTSVVYNTEEDPQFNVYFNYKRELKGFSKKLFDPFCRIGKYGIRVRFYYKPVKSPDLFIETTVGQLNFFRWIIKHKVLDYVIDHYKEIGEDMLLNSGKKGTAVKISAEKRAVLKKKLGASPKLAPKVNINAKREVTTRYVKYTVTFD